MCDNFYGNCHYKFARIIYVGFGIKKKKKKKKRRGGRGKKTIGEGAMSEKKIGNRGGEGKILSQASVEKFREFTCVNQSMDDRLG